jgi:phosphate-selective porin OprO/OprP
MTGILKAKLLPRRGSVRRLFTLALAAAGVLATTPVSFAGTDLKTSWSDGLSLQSEDKSFKLKVGGRLQNDWAWFDQTTENEAAFENVQDGTEFRRARLSVSGTVYDYVIFKAEYDFAGAGSIATDGKAAKEVALKDAYFGVTGIPTVGTLQIGHQKEPFGLEALTSDDFTTFMERSTLVFGSAVSDRNTGLRQQNAYLDGRLTVMSGIFRGTDDGGRDQQDGRYAGTVRVTGLPWKNEEKQGLFHLGGAYSYRNSPGAVEIKTAPSAHLAAVSDPAVALTTGKITTDVGQVFGGEAAVVYGPVSAQGEYALASLDAPLADDPSFQSYYAFLSVFVTGERRAYKASEGCFDRVSPKNNFRKGGFGALELVARYEFVDLNEKDITGGELTDITVGANWYMNPNARVMVNYVHSSMENVGTDAVDEGALSTLETRFQIDF